MKGIVLLILLVFRLQISLTRFFDVDEFTYLHWTGDLVRGLKPYVDFFLFVPPGFLWFLAPVVRVFWGSVDVFIAGRIVAFLIFLGILGSLGYLWKITRGTKHLLLPAIILAFLPMPYDKFLEIRPDNLATLIGLIGLISLIRKKYFWAGVCYGVSLLILPKSLPQVMVALLIAPSIARGIAVPFFIFGVWALTLGDLGKVWYSLTKLPFEANQIGRYFIMEPHLFFFPNASFYGLPAQAGGNGVTPGLLVNHAVWIIGLFAGIIALLTRWNTRDLLISGSFFALVYSYVEFFPLKHSQYLIPIAVFVSYYAAVAFSKLKEAILLLVLVMFVFVAWDVNRIKLTWTNDVQRNQTGELLKIIPKDSEVFDLEGRLMFWNNSYPICCLPMGSFTPLLSQKPEALAKVLEKQQTQYIFQGDTGRFTTLAASDEAYIREFYQPVPGWGEALWRRK